jgi:hypothetical protein
MSIPRIFKLLIPSLQKIHFSIPKSQGIQNTIHGERGIPHTTHSVAAGTIRVDENTQMTYHPKMSYTTRKMC